MTAVKNWFLEKNNLEHMYGKKLTIEKETDKAVLIRYKLNVTEFTQWIPKCCLCDEWEQKKKNINFAYHDYLVNKYHEAYDNQIIDNSIIRSGRNRYRGDNFIHQNTTKELIKALNSYGIEFMTKAEFAKTL